MKYAYNFDGVNHIYNIEVPVESGTYLFEEGGNLMALTSAEAFLIKWGLTKIANWLIKRRKAKKRA